MFALTTRSAHLLGFADVLEDIAARCASPKGQALARVPRFYDTVAQAQARLRQLAQAQAHSAGDDPLRLGSFAAIDTVLVRARRHAALECDELSAVCEVGSTCIRLRRWAAAHRASAAELWLLFATLPQLEDVTAVLEDALDERGQLRDEASPTLLAARRRARALATRLREDASAMLQSEQLAPLLMDSFVSIRNGRFVLPVHASYQSKVPGIVHNASQTGQTLFVEPDALVAQGNELTVAQAQVEAAELEVRRQLTAEVAACADRLEVAQALLVDIDVLMASGQYAAELGLLAPRFVAADEGDANEATLSLPGLSHPRLLLGAHPVQRSDVVLRAPAQMVMISGPNAGGKTVLLSSVALAAVMARAGLPVCTTSPARLPWLDAVSCSWGDNQSVTRGLSSFAAQLEALVQMTREAAPNQLLIIDELGGDTDPAEGAALAQAVLEHLATRGVWALVTTHLDALRALPLVDRRFVSARMATLPDGITPAFRLEQGAVGSSLALRLAERAGLAPELLARAHALRAEGGLLAQALETLEAERAALRQTQQELAQARVNLEQERHGLKKEADARAQAERAAHAQLHGEHRERLLAEARALRTLVAELRVRGERPAAQRALAALERDLAHGEPTPEPSSASDPSSALNVGQAVRVRALGKIGEVVAVDASAGLIELKLGAMRTRMRIGDVEPVATGRPRPAAIKVQIEASASAQAAAMAGRCDVRGLRMAEALTAVGRALDGCLSDGTGTLLIIHGHGPIRDEVRRALARSPYVGAHRPGDSHEGGDGVSVVQLDRA